MRSLIVRFLDCEGPGIIETSLKEAGYKVTYHDTYKKGLQLVPESHQIFDCIVLMGGPQTVYDPNQEEFFQPYFDLVENAMQIKGKKILGVCLGSQIIAKVLGAKVMKGGKGSELGFGNIKLVDKTHPLLSKIPTSELKTFHLHEDTFELPTGAKLLASSEKYQNQMFVYEKDTVGIQCHFEVTSSMLPTWWSRHKLNKSIGEFKPSYIEETNSMNRDAKIIFDTIAKGY